MQAVTQTVEAPEVAFTGDTSAQFIMHPGNGDALRARLLIMVRRPPCMPACVRQCAARRSAGSRRAPRNACEKAHVARFVKGWSLPLTGLMERRRDAAGAQELTFLDAEVTTEHARVRHRFTQQPGRSPGHASLLWPLLKHALAGQQSLLSVSRGLSNAWETASWLW